MDKNIFLEAADLSREKLQGLVADSLNGLDDGELFLEISRDESFVFDDGKLKNASFDSGQGFGLRGIAGEATAYAHSSVINEAEIKKAAQTIQAIKGEEANVAAPIIEAAKHKLYVPDSPLEAMEFAAKVKLLEDIDKYLRDKDPRVRQVSCSISGEWQAVMVARADGYIGTDFRPLVRLNVSVTVEDNERMEKGSSGAGGRAGYFEFVQPEAWQGQADEALRQALVNLQSIPAPAGEFPVVLGPGWPAVLLHEAVGHGLEGDFNRKKTSVFSEMMGKQVASECVTIIDDGTMQDRRGSLNIDDEGTPTKENVLIKDGKLVGLMQDRLNATLMGVEPTGNGRRESYACKPLPRMTNTFMANGEASPEDLFVGIKKGVYAPHFGGGQVDITNGSFVFSATEAYMIEDGKITSPIKGATLIGQGIDAMSKIEMVANDMALDKGVGTCGKDGQGVPVGVGQPSLKISAMTVGGTEV